MHVCVHACVCVCVFVTVAIILYGVLCTVMYFHDCGLEYGHQYDHVKGPFLIVWHVAAYYMYV